MCQFLILVAAVWLSMLYGTEMYKFINEMEKNSMSVDFHETTYLTLYACRIY